jgi:hypothetical protein
VSLRASLGDVETKETLEVSVTGHPYLNESKSTNLMQLYKIYCRICNSSTFFGRMRPSSGATSLEKQRMVFCNTNKETREAFV